MRLATWLLEVGYLFVESDYLAVESGYLAVLEAGYLSVAGWLPVSVRLAT